VRDYKYFCESLEKLMAEIHLQTDKGRYMFLIGHIASVYSFIEDARDILKEALKEGDLLQIKTEIERCDAFLSALTRLTGDNANLQNPI
jgi:hypothetical protein